MMDIYSLYFCIWCVRLVPVGLAIIFKWLNKFNVILNLIDFLSWTVTQSFFCMLKRKKWNIWENETFDLKQMILFYNRFFWKLNRSTRTLHILYRSFTEVSQHFLTEYGVQNKFTSWIIIVTYHISCWLIFEY